MTALRKNTAEFDPRATANHLNDYGLSPPTTPAEGSERERKKGEKPPLQPNEEKKKWQLSRENFYSAPRLFAGDRVNGSRGGNQG